MSLKSLLFSFIFYIPLIVFPQLVNKEINPMNVLFIGNSYTHYNSMPFIFQKMATSKNIKINVEMNAKSNHTFKMHSQRLDMYDVIRSKKWDYVVLQGFSRELKYDKEQIDTASLPYIKQILDSIYKQPLPNRYMASFAEFLSAHRGHYMIENIIEDGINDFFFAHLNKLNESWLYPIHFAGSVAYVFRDVIQQLATAYELEIGKIIKSPMEGLLVYHQQEK